MRPKGILEAGKGGLGQSDRRVRPHGKRVEMLWAIAVPNCCKTARFLASTFPAVFVPRAVENNDYFAVSGFTLDVKKPENSSGLEAGLVPNCFQDETRTK